MARPGRSEDTSVPIWLRLSAADAAKMEQVLARPEFKGWTRGEWCLEIIQTALRYYTKPRPAGEPGRKRAPAPPDAEGAPPPAGPAPSRARPARTAAKRRRPPARRASPSRDPEPAAPEPATPESVPPESVPPESLPPESLPPGAAAEPDCSHPAEARDYQSGTCAACGAILWD